MTLTESLLTPGEAAQLLRTNVRTLERWRSTGDGPSFAKIGKRVAYHRAELERWVEQRTRRTTSDQAA
jgi:excisionase family DNA binding protein